MERKGTEDRQALITPGSEIAPKEEISFSDSWSLDSAPHSTSKHNRLGNLKTSLGSQFWVVTALLPVLPLLQFFFFL